MDVRVEVTAIAIGLAMSPEVTVTTVIVIDDLAIELVSLFDHASTLSSLLALAGTSRNAVAPDFNNLHLKED